MPESVTADGRWHTAQGVLVGWINLITDEFWRLPRWHKPPEYQIDPAWEPVYMRAQESFDSAGNQS